MTAPWRLDRALSPSESFLKWTNLTGKKGKELKKKLHFRQGKLGKPHVRVVLDNLTLGDLAEGLELGPQVLRGHEAVGPEVAHEQLHDGAGAIDGLDGLAEKEIVRKDILGRRPTGFGDGLGNRVADFFPSAVPNFSRKSAKQYIAFSKSWCQIFFYNINLKFFGAKQYISSKFLGAKWF